ncbi:MAG: hypothetical protein ACKVWV_09685 [Planctomycetota bacterium]
MNEHELSNRLDRLERENRRWKRVVVGVAGSVAALGVLAMATPVCDVITGERLVLRDSSGRQRFMIDAYQQGTPTIVWNDASGKAIARFGLENDGLARITYFDAHGKVRACERVGADGASGARNGAKTDEAPAIVKN